MNLLRVLVCVTSFSYVTFNISYTTVVFSLFNNDTKKFEQIYPCKMVHKTKERKGPISEICLSCDQFDFLFILFLCEY